MYVGSQMRQGGVPGCSFFFFFARTLVVLNREASKIKGQREYSDDIDYFLRFIILLPAHRE